MCVCVCVCVYVVSCLQDAKLRGVGAFELAMPFDERAFVAEHQEYLMRGLKIQDVRFVTQVCHVKHGYGRR